MNRCNIIIVFLVKAYESVGVLDAIHEVRATLYHTLIDEFLEWLVLTTYAEVEEELVPEA